MAATQDYNCRGPTTLPMTTPEELNARTADFYDANPSLEDDRLRKHRIEFEVTLRTILSVLPLERTGLRILDIGGGTGTPYPYH